MVAYIAGKLNVKINYYDEKSHIATFNNHLLSNAKDYLL